MLFQEQWQHPEATVPLQQLFSFEPPAALPLQSTVVHSWEAPRAASATRPPCASCGRPIEGLQYPSKGRPGAVLHAECKARELLCEAREEELLRRARDAKLKERHRADFGIGWKPSKNSGKAVGLVLSEDGQRVHVEQAPSPEAAVDEEYLRVALRVRREEGREALFSLDPLQMQGCEEGRELRWQAKRFEPAWLAGTSVGELLFQADYHLKELSMGEALPPVLGLAPADFSEAGWRAREWFCVRRAELSLGEEGALLPWVELGVEAREMVRGPDGSLQDARLTRPEHPLVRYAAAFTEHFELIAERRDVFFRLRELAKASLLAKFLLEEGLECDAIGDLVDDGDESPRQERIPQLWSERTRTRIAVRDGAIVHEGGCSGTTVNGVYGGVQLSLQQWNISKKTLQPLPGSSFYPKGIDLSLDGTSLAATRPAGLCGQEEDVAALGKVFATPLADRKAPRLARGGLAGVRESLKAEEELRQKRFAAFASSGFNRECPGALFPASWTPPVAMELVGEARGKGRCLAACEARRTEAACLLLQRPGPAFEEENEEKSVFRVYEVGGMELRTVQAAGEAEQLVAVFQEAQDESEPGEDDYGDLNYAI